MANAIWPITLPTAPLYDGNQRALADNLIKFPTDVGPGKRRKRYTANRGLASYSFKMTGAQLTTFKTFYEDTIANGALPYEWTDPETAATDLWLLDAPPAIVRVGAAGGDYYIVTLELRLTPTGEASP